MYGILDFMIDIVGELVLDSHLFLLLKHGIAQVFIALLCCHFEILVEIDNILGNFTKLIIGEAVGVVGQGVTALSLLGKVAQILDVTPYAPCGKISYY